MQIISNNKPRHIIYGFELSEKQKLEFEYLDDINDNTFFRYKGNIYNLSDFMLTPNNLKVLGFDGYMSDSYFSGVLIKLCNDNESVIVARYYY